MALFPPVPLDGSYPVLGLCEMSMPSGHLFTKVTAGYPKLHVASGSSLKSQCSYLEALFAILHSP